MAKPSVCVIIPTLNAAEYLPTLVDALRRQTVVPSEILLVDSQSDDSTLEIAESLSVRFLSVDRKNFDHGGTRNEAARSSQSDYILFLSQDALPANEKLIENLLASFDVDERVAAAYARQLPYANADAIEKLTRAFNYPDQSQLKSRESLDKLGIKTYFFSDVCSIYKRSVFEEIGGFETPIITNEDMLMAYRMLNRNYKTYYQADALVYHSHHYTIGQQYRRNFDVGAFLAMYPDIDAGTTKEGMRMVVRQSLSLMKRLKIISVFRLFVLSLAKWKGNRDGHRYASYSREQIMEKTAQKNFWHRYFDK